MIFDIKHTTAVEREYHWVHCEHFHTILNEDADVRTYVAAMDSAVAVLGWVVLYDEPYVYSRRTHLINLSGLLEALGGEKDADKVVQLKAACQKSLESFYQYSKHFEYTKLA